MAVYQQFLQQMQTHPIYQLGGDAQTDKAGYQFSLILFLSINRDGRSITTVAHHCPIKRLRYCVLSCTLLTGEFPG